MKINKFIKNLEKLNLSLAVKRGKLVLEGDENKLSDEDFKSIKEKTDIIDFIKQHKKELIDYILLSKGHSPDNNSKSITSMYRLSGLQEGMLFHGLYAEHSGGYVEQFSCELTDVDVPVFLASWHHLLKSHSILRSSFHYEEFSIPVQCVHGEVDLPVSFLDYRNLSEVEQESAVSAYLLSDRRKGFEFRSAPLMRIGLIRINAGQYKMIWTHHHMLLDGWSVQVMMKELLSTYELLSSGDRLPLITEDLYEDYIRYIERRDKEKEEHYWRGYLAGVESGTLLPFITGPSSERNKGIGSYGEEYLRIDGVLTGETEKYIQDHHVTMNTLMQGIWSYLLHSYTGNRSITYGVTVSGRPNDLPGMEDRVGMYINTLPLHSVAGGGDRITDWLQQLQQSQLESREYQHTVFSDIQKWTNVPGDLFDSLLVFENYPVSKVIRSRSWSLQVSSVEVTEQTNYPLSISIVADKEISISFSYNTHLLSSGDVHRIAGHFEHVLRQVISNTKETLGELELLTAAERKQLLEDFNDTNADYPRDKTVVELFTAQAMQTPEAVAVVFEEQELSYRELDERSNQLGHYLRGKGVKAETLVPICIDRGLEMIVGILGILKAGGAYVPIDPEYPRERMSYMLEDTGGSVIVSSSSQRAVLPSGEGRVIVELDTDWQEIRNEPVSSVDSGLTSANLAYVIYTSGSTGKPKGVMIEHKSVVNLLTSISNEVEFTSSSSFLSVTTYSFDICYLELYTPLIQGGKLIIVSRETASDGFRLKETLARYQPTHMQGTPSTWQILADVDWRNAEHIKMLIGGEAVRESIKAYLTAIGEVWNVYGPTETTIWSTIEKLAAATKINIGKPISNTQIYILDKGDKLSPVSVIGEICIGGSGLARGYLNRAELTAEKFIKHPYSAEAGSRLYRTGDLGRWLPDGNIEFIGRVDDQVKIRGYRIELGEIESALNKLAPVQNCCVLLKRQEDIGESLICYYLPNADFVKTAEHGFHNIQVDNWKNIYESQYRSDREHELEDPEFNTLIWNDSFTGKAIPTEQMREWQNDIVEIVLAEKPEYVLEIGCGTGLIYYPLSGKLKKYTGTDLSRYAIEKIKDRIAKGSRDYGVSEWQVSAAHEISIAPDERLDTVIINSIVQYFPSADYLSGVIGNSIGLLNGQGRIIIGDVRDKRLLEPFKGRVQLSKAGNIEDIRDFNWVIGQEVAKEEELCFTPEYFYSLPLLYPEITHVEVQWKKSSFYNELSLYRYTVIIYVGIEKEIFAPSWENWDNENCSQVILHNIKQGREIVAIKDAPNPRLWQDKQLHKALYKSTTTSTADLLSAISQQAKESIEIETILKEAAQRGYYCRFLLDEDPFRVNILLELNPSNNFIKPAYSDKDTFDGRSSSNIPLFAEISNLMQKEIRIQLQEYLPDYMIPSDFIALQSFPLNSSGKVDRKFLSERIYKTTGSKFNYQAPRNGTEEELAQIWQELLNVDRIGIHDNFFELGGHSLLVTRVISAIRRQLNAELKVRDIFTHPTIAELSAELEDRSAGLLPSIEAYSPRPERIPLSFGQERLWFIDQLEGSVHYHIPSVLRLKGSVDKGALANAIQGIINRHEVLRTVIADEDGTAYQRILPADSWSLGLTEAGGYAAEPLLLQEKIVSLTGAAFDLSRDHKLRAELIRLEEQEHLLVITLHHIASDGWSVPILVKELIELYNAGVSGGTATLPPLPVQYADYSIWQRGYLQGEVLSGKLGYWQDRLEGVLPLELPSDYGRPAIQSTRGAQIEFKIDKATAAGIRGVCRSEGVTLFMTLLSAFKVLLYRYSGQEDICVGSAIANRGQHEVEDLVGFFVNTLALRSSLRGEQTFRELLQQVREMAMGAYEHQDVPFEKVVDAVVKERDMSRSPLFQVIFHLQNNAEAEMNQQSLSGLELTMEGSGAWSTSKFDLALSLMEGEEGLHGGIEYRTDLYKPETIGRMAVHYEQLLRSIVSNPSGKVGELELLTAAERKQLLEDFNDTNADYPRDKTVVELFTAQAMQRPEAVAVVFEEQELSYRELDERSNQLGHYLRGKGVKAETLVPICIDRGLEMIVGILGIMKAGGAYVPVDPEYPRERMSYMLEDTGGSVIVSSSSQRAVLPSGEGRVIVELDTDWEAIRNEPVSPVDSGLTSGNLAYVIYTSGSTGKPKGVMIEHTSLVNLVYSQRGPLNLREGIIVFQFASISFDASCHEIFCTLSAGGKLVLGTKENIQDSASLGRLLNKHEVELITLPPSYQSALINEPLYLKTIISAGEPLHYGLACEVQKKQINLINAYGPTENTVSTALSLSPIQEDGCITIGKPNPNTQIYILDKGDKLSPLGVIGEICIGGSGLARGYLNRAELTGEKFIKHPYSAEAGSRLYRTGDLGRWLPDGNIEFIGRVDDQVKIRGYRIELGEIESVLGHCELVSQAIVLVKNDPHGDKKLLSYYIPNWQSIKTVELEYYQRQVATWKELYEIEYKQTEIVADIDEEFNIIGWNDSFTGLPISAEQMREWLDDIVSLILSEKAGNVLEIGCGTGLIFYKLVGKVDKYLGTDLSKSAVNQITSTINKGLKEYGSVELWVSSANEVSLPKDERADTIVLNSIIQYFPGEGYLDEVIARSLKMLNGSGRIIIGDVRDNRSLELFKLRLQMQKLQSTANIPELIWAAEQEVLKVEELCLSPEYFYKLQSLYPEITHVHIEWKHGSFINELTSYRYNVVIYVGIDKPGYNPEWQNWQGANKKDISDQLNKGTELIAIKDAPNPRLWKEKLLNNALNQKTAGSLDDLSAIIECEDQETSSINEILAVAQTNGYQYRLLLDEDIFKVNVLIEKTKNLSFIQGVALESNQNGSYTNIPLFADISAALRKDIRCFLQQHLPDYMIPQDFIPVRQMPLTNNGKVDRRFLSQREEIILHNTLNYEPASTMLEQKLINIWQELLNVDRIGIHDNFFELGGHSLLATRLVAAIRKQMQADIATKEIFNNPTIALLSTYLEIQPEGSLLPSIEAYSPRPERIPLSFGQERLWFIDQLEGSVHYHIPSVLRLKGSVDKAALANAIQGIINRHEVLRTVIADEDGTAYQRILPADSWSLGLTEAGGYAAEPLLLQEKIVSLTGAAFDLSRDHKLRAELIRLEEQEHLLVITLHHIASDGWSVPILVKELIELYNAGVSGGTATLPPLPVQYADYSIWQRGYLQGEVLSGKLGYWQDRLEGVLPLELPSDYGRPAIQSTRGAQIEFKIDKATAAGIRGVCRSEGVTLFMTLLSAFKVLLYRYSGQEDICVGSAIANRGQHEVEDLVGFFVNTLALRSSLRGEQTFRELLQQVREMAMGAYEHQDVPFEKVVDVVVKERDMSRSPLFQVMFNLQNNAEVTSGSLTGITLKPEASKHQTSQFDLTFSLMEGEEGLHGGIEYCTDLYKPETIDRMAVHYEQLLRSIVSNPSGKVGELELLTAAERKQLLEDFNDTNADYPRDKTVVELFTAQAMQTPEAVAVVFEEQELSYRELDERSNQLGHYLRGKGVKAETLVPICIDRGLEMIVGILGILKAGGAYVPVDPEYPRERMSYMLEDTGGRVIVSSSSQRAVLPSGEGRVIVELDTDWEAIRNEPVSPVDSGLTSGNLAYVIYTSGSTGKPKGVMVEHRNVVNFILGMTERLSVTKDSNLLAITSISFDISVLELFWTICNGIMVTLKGNNSLLNNYDKYHEPKKRQVNFSLFYFASQSGAVENKYQFLLDSVTYADKNNFSSVWLPERHFHEFGGLFPNPAVLGAGLATITNNIQIRSGSVVLPLNDVIRVAEEWSIVDNLSNGRVSLSIASGWHADDFVLMPDNYKKRHEIMYKQIGELKALWSGSGIKRVNGNNKEVEIKIFPRPVQTELSIWITTAGNAETFKSAGKIGAKILTHLLGQSIEELAQNISAYKQSLKENGHDPENAEVALMLHTYLGTDYDLVKSEVKEPFKSYLRSNLSLLKNLANALAIQIENISESDINDLLEIAFERYWQTAALLGTVESSELLVKKLSLIGVTEIACLIDFGIDDKLVLNSLEHLNELRLKFDIAAYSTTVSQREHIVTDLQITPSYLSALIEDATSQQFLRSLDVIMVGGERLPEALLEKLLSRTAASVYNMYGPTETTIWSTMKAITKDSGITIGKPIQNTSIYILNSTQALCPIGAYGELYIGGAGVSRGYYNKEDLTLERFVRNPYSDDRSSRLYKTGDTARWLPNGELEIAGRRDDQLKIRGHRIEPGEIEYLLNQHESVGQSVIVGRDNFNGVTSLVGFIVPSGPFDKEGILGYLRSRLPEYMIPSLLVELSSIPLTSNGKIDRRALPAVDASTQMEKLYTAPRNETEEKLAQIWQDLMGVEQVGVHDGFFELGGHSLLAIRLVATIRKELNTELTVRDIFTRPTIGELSAHIQGSILGDVLPSIEAYAARPDRIPLSFGQERLWFIDQLEGSVHYHIPSVLRLKGSVDKGALANAIQGIINRHEVLRTVIADEDGTAYQRILPADSWSLGLTEAGGYAAEPLLLQEKIVSLTGAAFDLSRDHKLRAELIRLEEQEHLLVITLHHIASDGWSVPILVKELIELYNAGVSGGTATLPPLPVQYADYSIWQRGYLQGEVLSGKLGYWQDRLEGVLPLELPSDYGRPAIQSTRGAQIEFKIDKATAAGIRGVCRSEGVTLFMTLLSAFKVLLYRYSGQEDICVGSAIANRGQHEVEDLVGFFVNTLALRSSLRGEQTFRELLQQVREMAMGAYEHQDVPFEKVVDAVVKERDMSRSPLFQVMFDLENIAEAEMNPQSLSGLELTMESSDHTTSKFDLMFSLTEGEEGLRGGINYRTDLYKPETIGRMAVHYEQLLRSIVSNPSGKVGELELLTAAERKQLLEDFNDTNAEYPRDKTVVELFTAQAMQTPEAVAVVFEEQELSYRDLNERSNQLGHYLRGKGVKAETLVPICIDRGLEMIVGILGIMKAGGAYVPVDPEYPRERMSYMLEDTGGRVIVSSSSQRAVLPSGEGRVIVELDTDWEAIRNEPVSPVDSGLTSANLAYVIYTSGSTGKPKGVMIEHTSLVNYLFNNKTRYLSAEINPGGSILNLSYTFDASITAMFMPLLSGKMLVVGSKSLTAVFGDESVRNSSPYDFIKLTPAQMGLVETKLKGLTGDGLTKKLVIGGEALKTSHIESLYGTDIEIINEYGPTEATVGSSTYTFNVKDGAEKIKDIIPIGKPMPNTQIYILDKGDKLSPLGVIGEICIGGSGLARGYLNRAELTAEKFIKHPYSAEAGSRLYRTGDLGRWLPDGNIEFIGRLDDQVKIRGYRIELGEIESVLGHCELVSQAVVLAREDQGGNKRLVGYIVPEGDFDKEGVLGYLRSRLPEYMVPSLLLALTAMPLTSNGKVDRRSLPDPDLTELLSEQYAAPRNGTEEELAQIWQELLNVDRIGIHDNFFELGGHSLLAIRVISAIRKRLGIEMPIDNIFDYPTIGELSTHLQGDIPAGLLPSIEAYSPRPERIPLSFGQERLWFIDQLEGSVHYHIPSVLRLKGSVDKAALANAIQGIINRHEVLRTVIADEDGTAYQRILPADSWSLGLTEAGGYAAEPLLLQEKIVSLTGAAFDLSRDHKLRAELIRLEEQEHLLVITLHHIASDGWSVPILVKELIELYNAGVSGGTATLPPLPVQYADYSIWQRGYLQGEVLSGKLGYWQDRLEGVLPLELPSDYGRPAIQSTRGAQIEFKIDKATAAGIRGVCRSEGVTLFMTLLSAFKVLLYRYSGQEDICVGSAIANRGQHEVEDLVGFFVNTLALRSSLRGEQTFRELLQQVREMAMGAYEHQDVPFEKVVDVVVKERDMSRSPLFQVMFNLQNNAEAEVNQQSLSGLELMMEGSGDWSTTKFDLTFSLTEGEEGLHGGIEYCTDLYKPETIDRMAVHYEQLLRSIVSNPSGKLGELELLTAAERKQLLEDFNDTNADYPRDKTVVELFTAQAMQRPEAVAVVFEEQELSYRELDERSNQLAHCLRNQTGIKQGEGVAVLLDRSEWSVISMIGIMKLGCVYVPIDKELPPARILFMLEQSGSKVLITDEPLVAIVYPANVSLFRFDMMSEQRDAPPVQVAVAGDDSSYIIYTSGSTGQPKGVEQTHQMLYNLIRWDMELSGMLHSQKHLQFSSYSFDSSIHDVYYVLATGGELHVVGEKLRKDLWKLKDYLLTEKINTLSMPYAALKVMFSTLTSEEFNGHHLNEIISTGEQLYIDGGLRIFLEEHPSVRIHNLYGPSETHVVTGVSYNYASGPIPEKSSIGKPVSNTWIYIVDKQMRLVPVGVHGDIYIGGRNLAKGYYGNNERTLERFIKDPFKEGEVLYRTGDLGRWLPDGNIEFIGRLDDQVKIRGYRIELGEIESVLGHCELVSQAVVLAREDQGGNKRLVGYIVPEGDFDKEGVLGYLRSRLPEYMVPSLLLALTAMPLTSNGKVDRRSLPDPDLAELLSEQYVAPRNGTEEELAQIWQELLNVDRIGIHDNFFELGGHSLLVTRVISAIRRQLNAELKVRDIFTHPTIAELSAELEDRSAELLPSIEAYSPRPERIPLSFGQERLWFIDQLEGSVHYHIPSVLRLKGSVDKGALANAIQGIINRHEVLRTVIADEDGTAYQRILPADSWSLGLTEAGGYAAEPLLLQEKIVSLTGAAFDLSRDHKLRAELIRLEEQEHLLVITLHHIASDGWSVPILVKELIELYNAGVSGGTATLPPLPVQYADYSIWQRGYLQGEVLSGKLGYWQDRLEGVLPLELPSDYGRPAIQSTRGAQIEFKIDKATAAGIRGVCRSEGVTLFMTLLSAFKVLLYRYSGQEDICVGSAIANRGQHEVEDLVGFFVNTLALRSSLRGEQTFRELLQQVREMAMGAYEHQDVPFEKVVDAVVKERDMSRSPLFQVIFHLQNNAEAEMNQQSLSGLELMMEGSGAWSTSKFDLALSLMEGEEGLRGGINYRTDLYKPETIGRMAVHYEQLLRSIVSNPSGKVGELELLTAAERKQLLEDFNDTNADYPRDKTVVELFTAQAMQRPEAVAVVFEEQELSYRELDERSNQLGHYLRGKGVKAETLVPICIDRGLEMIVGMLGILKAGGAYVPVDPEYPRERMSYMLEDTGGRVIVSSSSQRTVLPSGEGRVIVELDTDWEAIRNEPVSPVDSGLTSGNLAYVIYTSGSTGKPKGVMIEHASLVNLVYWHIQEYELSSLSKATSLAGVSFDAFGWEIWPYLSVGSSIYILENKFIVVPELVTFCIQKNITHSFITTALIPEFVKNSRGKKLPMKYLLTGGDRLLPIDIQELNYLLINNYGPTEYSVVALNYRLSDGEKSATVPVGKPISNTQIYVLDKGDKLSPVGVIGEICIGGSGLARGYLNRPELTEEKFIKHPYSGKAGARLYRTGDLGRWLPDGNIEFIGRVDDQVKIRGYRIELGEIESVLGHCELVSQAVVLAREDQGGNKRLVGYIVPEGSFDKEGILGYLRSRLPEYMVPSLLLALTAMPLTSNGKVDRRSLPDPDLTELLSEQYVAPRNGTEEQLAKIWQELLGLDRVGIHDNFFELGGHSLLAIKLASAIKKEFEVELSIKTFFQITTIDSLAKYIEIYKNNILINSEDYSSIKL